jgi:hypothetical protein
MAVAVLQSSVRMPLNARHVALFQDAMSMETRREVLK